MDDHERRKRELEQKYFDEEISKRRKKYLGPDRTSEEIPAASLWRYQHQATGPTTSQSPAPAFVEDSTDREQSRNTSSGLPPVWDPSENCQNQRQNELPEASLEQATGPTTSQSLAPAFVEDSTDREQSRNTSSRLPLVWDPSENSQHQPQNDPPEASLEQGLQSRTRSSSPPSSSSSSNHSSPSHSHLEDSEECCDEEIRVNCQYQHGYAEDQDLQHLQQHPDQALDLQHDEGHVQDNGDHHNAEVNPHNNQDIRDNAEGEQEIHDDQYDDQENQEDGQDNGEGDQNNQQEHENNGDGQAQQQQNLSHTNLRGKMLGPFGDRIDTAVGATRNDMLYMALGFALRNNEPNLALNHVVKLLNNIFVSPILPTSSYLLDKLLKDDIGVQYHFYCHSCTQSFGQLDYKNIKTHICDNENCRKENVISDLRIASYFVIFDVAIQLQILLSDPDLLASLATPEEAVERCQPNEVSDISNGSMYKEFAASTSHLNGRVISGQFNTDGTPVAENSKNSIWPIQLSINELPFDKRSGNLLLAGLWFGKSQPKMDLFLGAFVDKLTEMSHGFHLDNIGRVYFFAIGCCVDSGARGSVQGIKKHSGFYSCNWCPIRGLYFLRAVRYPLPEADIPDRTHQQMVQLQIGLLEEPLSDDEDDEDEEEPIADHRLGVKAVSPLINLPKFDMVRGFFVDVMHMVDLGICRSFWTLWLDDVGAAYYIGLSETEINRRIQTLRPPVEFRRKPRDLSERAWFSAKECNNFLMFECIPVMKNILGDMFLNIWLLLIQALYLLSQNEVSIDHCNVAAALITHFLVKTQTYYGDVNISYNLHILKHLAAHVLRWGPSWASSAYAFEAGNGVLKKLIHSVGCIPHQILRAFSWMLALKLLEPYVSQTARDYVQSIMQPKSFNQKSTKVEDCRLLGSSQEPVLSEEDVFLCERHGCDMDNLCEYKELVYKQCLFTTSAVKSSWSNNSVAQLCDRSIVVIHKILLDHTTNSVILLVSNVNCECLLRLPAGVRLDPKYHFMRNITSIDEERRSIPVSDLKIICFRASFPHGDYVAPFPNVHNRF